ncbi:RNA polymerase sigma factor [Agrococcus sp. SL85]|uniref:RNA polymerase sigma factor n=1 Tax=Agrococcus sp. SL85 TaxID=2995141 RepID=UPI00226CCEAE|nr:DUF6596 domain-containing protein [Agrococcus sp. SL85]WAC67251.1 RNA polymerase sigma factor [Agrococcus sp. SL85]
MAPDASAAVAAVVADDHARVMAAVVGTLGDWSVAEDAVQDALERALARWPADGVPDSPAAWVTTVARRRGIDLLRSRAAADRAAERLAREPAPETAATPEAGFPHDDERLALLHTACHPAIAADARAALALRAVLGVPVARIARLFGVGEDAMQKRLVRARAKIRHARIPYRVPGPAERPARSEGVRQVLYGLFAIGYAAPADADARAAADEAIRLARLCRELTPERTHERLEADGLLALMLLQHARRDARLRADGSAVPLPEQDRGRWDRAAADEGLALVDAAIALAASTGLAGGRHLVHAAIAAEHVRPELAAHIDHRRVVALYRVLEQLDGSPFVVLNRAIAQANAGDAAGGLEALDGLEAALGRQHLLHAARGDALARLGRRREAAEALRHGAALAPTDQERRALLAAAQEEDDR